MKTPIQEVFSDLNTNHRELFDVHTPRGRKFINDYSKYLEKEKDFLAHFFVYILASKPTGMIEEIINEYLNNEK